MISQCNGYFRSVLFNGQIQRKTAGYIDHTLFGSDDRSISVAINTIGLHVIGRTTPPVRKYFVSN